MPVDALTVLLSASVGAIVAGLAGWANERLRWRRTYQARWDADRRRTYASFLASCVIYSDAITDLARALDGGEVTEIAGKEGLLYKAHRELMAPLFEQRLLGREQLLQAADLLKDNLDAYRDAVTKRQPTSSEVWESKWVPLRNAVINAARKELSELPLKRYQ